MGNLDFVRLSRWCLSALDLLESEFNSVLPAKILKFIQLRTLAWSRISERILQKHYYEGFPAADLPPTVRNKQQASKGWLLLSRSGLVVQFVGCSGKSETVINFAALLVRLLRWKELSGCDIQELVPDMIRICRDVMNRLPTEAAQQMEDSMSELEQMVASEKARCKMERRVRPLRVESIKVMCKDLVEEIHGGSMSVNRYAFDSLTLKKARNWIHNCKKQERDPKAILRQIIRRWPDIVGQDPLRRKPFVQGLTPGVFDFSRFMDYQRSFMTWLENNPERRAADTVIRLGAGGGGVVVTDDVGYEWLITEEDWRDDAD